MFKKLLSRSGDGGRYLALDIGTEVVKSLIFEYDKDQKKGVVVGVGKERQMLGNMRSGAVSDISGVIESSRNAIEMAKEKSKTKRIENATIGIAGELVKGTTTTVHYERIKPEIRIEVSELKEIIEQVQLKAYERIQKQLAQETNQEHIDIKLINAAIVDVRIDGYKITNPIKFQGRDVSISIFNAYAPLVHLGAIEKVADELGVSIMAIVAEPYAVSRSVMNEDNLDFSAIFIDVGGGTTDIAVVREGGLEGTKMFPLGGQAFTKQLAQEYTLSFEEAEKLKLSYSSGALDPGIQESVREIFQEDSRLWVGGLELAFMEFAESSFLPSRILLCGGGTALEEIRQALLTPEWVEELPFAKSPTVNFLEPKDVRLMVDDTGELTTPQDVTPLSLANLTIEMIQEEKLLAGILRRFAKKINTK